MLSHKVSHKRQRFRAVSHSWMSAEERRREYKRLWARVQRQHSRDHNASVPSTLRASEAQQPQDTLPPSDISEMSFDNIGIIAVNDDTVQEPTFAARKEYMDPDMDGISSKTSNVESEEEPEKRRKTVPSRYRTDDESEEEMPPKRRKASPPSPPSLPEPPSWTAHTPQGPSQTAHTPQEPSQTAHAPQEPSQTAHAPQEPSQTAHAPQEPSLRDLQQLILDTEKRLLMTLSRIQADLDRVVQQARPDPASVATSSQQQEAIERPCQTVEQLKELQLKLEGPEEKKRMIQFLSQMGGSSLGDTVRRSLRKLANNDAWAHYSLKGRKGKLPFMGTSLHHVVLRACARQFPGATEKDIDACIGDTLKHAPHRAKVGPKSAADVEPGAPQEDSD